MTFLSSSSNESFTFVGNCNCDFRAECDFVISRMITDQIWTLGGGGGVGSLCCVSWMRDFAYSAKFVTF